MTEVMHMMGNCLEDMSLAHGLIFGLFFAGLVGGFSHCVAMCGPFVMSQTGRMDKISEAALIPYHVGRLMTYVLLAVLFYSVLNVVFLYLPVRSYVTAPILLTASFLFLLNAYPKLAGIFPFVASIKISLPYKWVSKAFNQLSDHPTMIKKWVMGLILGFMPCGMVTTALIASATAPDITTAATAMAAFGVGTMPALILTAFAGQAIQLKYPNVTPYLTRGMMIWSSAWLLILAGITLIQTR